MSSSSILQEALLRAASLREPRGTSRPASDTEDNVFTTVHSPVTSPPQQSRATSPGPDNSAAKSGTSSRNQSRAGAKAKREQAMKLKLASRDPLVRFSTDVCVRIFTIVGLGADGCGGHLDGSTFSAVKDLLNCGLVCQKWRKSQTINYVWYKLCQHASYSVSYEEEFGPLTWTRKDSKTDWRVVYRQRNQTQSHQIRGPISEVIEEDEEMNSKELREQRWKEESESQTFSKLEARAYYKDFGGRKLKSKTGKGLGSDRTGWEDREFFE